MSDWDEEQEHLRRAQADLDQRDLIAEELEEIRAKELTMVRTDMDAREMSGRGKVVLAELESIEEAWWTKRDRQLLDLVVDLLVTGRAITEQEAFTTVLHHLNAIPSEVIQAKVQGVRAQVPW